MIKTKKLLVKLNTLGKQMFVWPAVQYKIAPSSAGAYAKYIQEEAAVWKQFPEIQNEKAQIAKNRFLYWDQHKKSAANTEGVWKKSWLLDEMQHLNKKKKIGDKWSPTSWITPS